MKTFSVFTLSGKHTPFHEYRVGFHSRTGGFLTAGLLALIPTVSLAGGKNQKTVTLEPLSSIAAHTPGVSAAEIVAHDPATQRLFVVNAVAAQIEVFDIHNPASPFFVGAIDVTPYGAVANSVAVNDGVVAIAVEASPKTAPGSVVFFDTGLHFLAAVKVGAQPDMLTFSPDGRYVVTANEGEPSDDYTVDPEGSVSIVDVSGGVGLVQQSDVRTAGFTAFNGMPLAPDIRVFGPGASAAQDFEPEYLTITPNSKTAYVTLQENNALATVDLKHGVVTGISSLGTKNHLLPGNGLDAGDRDGVINIQPWPVSGFYLPDSIASYKVGGDLFLVMANEGDSRAYTAFNEETRVNAANYVLDPVKFPNAAALKTNAQIGRLRVTNTSGDTDGDGDIDVINSFGARSFSIRRPDGTLVWDSGDQLERITAEEEPAFFNASNANNLFDDRSDDKGPEPEGIALGKAFGREYAFVGLERIGGIMVFDISNPSAPVFADYVNNRDFTQPTTVAASGDLGPEGLIFISASDSPTNTPLIVAGNEISGTTTLYELKKSK
ncbi:MAG: alkaline phosphatase [Verrucomicrobiaceae bacterium]|nr:MAG: alkaline phosphatase [Verrucomicrobiaceae bacterium]